MRDHDVRDLLDRAAELAPASLDRPAVSGQAGRRLARRAASGSVAAVLVAGAAVLAVPLVGGDEQRLAQQPASGGPVPAGPQMQTYLVRYVDASTYDEERASRALDRCAALPGAEHTSGFATLPPQPAVTVTGTAEQRRAVEDCLRALPNTHVELVRTQINASPVAVSVDAVGLEPLAVRATAPRPDPDGEAWLMHELTLTNQGEQPVYLNDFRFAQTLTDARAQDSRSAEGPGRLFVALGCGFGQAAPGEPFESFCHDVYDGTIIEPGASETFQIKLWRDPSQTLTPQPAGSRYTAQFPIRTRTTEPFDAAEDTGGPEETISLTYDIAVDAPVANSRERASFRSLAQPGAGAEMSFRTARAEGILGGDPTTGCLWLSAPDGTGSTPIVLLHNTAVADFSRTPWVVRDADRVLATEGDRVFLGGGYGPDGEQSAVPGCPVTGPPFTGQLTQPPAG